MKIHTFTVGPFSENTYLLTQEGEALLIDPGFYNEGEFNSFQQKLDEQQTQLKAVVLTHAHVDHVLGLQKTLSHYDVPVYLSDKDRYLWQNFSQQAQAFGFEAKPFDFTPSPLPLQQDWQISSFKFDTRYTPGHAPDHMILHNEENNIVIAGDTLFKEGIGRTDLYKGNFELLEKSINEQLYTLPDQTKVYPGHGPTTTIGHEKQANPFVKMGK